MTDRGTTEPEAFRWLQRTAMNHRTSMLHVAIAVIERRTPVAISAPSTGRQR